MFIFPQILPLYNKKRNKNLTNQQNSIRLHNQGIIFFKKNIMEHKELPTDILQQEAHTATATVGTHTPLRQAVAFLAATALTGCVATGQKHSTEAKHVDAMQKVVSDARMPSEEAVLEAVQKQEPALDCRISGVDFMFDPDNQLESIIRKMRIRCDGRGTVTEKFWRPDEKLPTQRKTVYPGKFVDVNLNCLNPEIALQEGIPVPTSCEKLGIESSAESNDYTNLGSYPLNLEITSLPHKENPPFTLTHTDYPQFLKNAKTQLGHEGDMRSTIYWDRDGSNT